MALDCIAPKRRLARQNRRLSTENTSFQTIKDGLRRDLAIRDLAAGKSINAIAQDTGFASTANFHRAFKQWAGTTPVTYRRTLARP
ncbi:helix-turn-helix domain-containing protein [Celeribacter baekdonensis]|uniref:helix-turn-helix domain-containing protein n=1 Tax=Celeribacter baekdonensis TaxID=875171 RepID=UPI001FE2380B|nr:AraC family transcriptional regulator [Celeribacter baekdonensis]